MRSAARSLSSFVGRHRWPIVIAWLIVVAVALPLAAKQTENLTGGGFEVPGSESAAVDETVQEKYALEAGSTAIGVVLEASPGATEDQLNAAVDRLAAEVAEVETIE